MLLSDTVTNHDNDITIFEKKSSAWAEAAPIIVTTTTHQRKRFDISITPTNKSQDTLHKFATDDELWSFQRNQASERDA